MSSFYIKYSESRIGLTGSEYLPGFLDQYYPDVSFNEVLSDGLNHYGIISGSGDDLAKAFLATAERFSISKLDETQFIGLCRMAYNPVTVEGEDPPPDFATFMSGYGVTVTDELAAVKKAKRYLFKEIVQRKLEPINDNIATLTKSLMVQIIYYDELSTEEKTAVDAATEKLKDVYSKTMCVDEYTEMADNLQSVLMGYYSAVVSLESQTTVEEALLSSYD